MSTFKKPERVSALVCTIVALSLASCSGGETDSDDQRQGHAAHWGYEADDGPDDWSSMDSEWILCAEGLAQSPIDLANATEIELPAAEIHTPSEQEVEVLNQKGVLGALQITLFRCTGSFGIWSSTLNWPKA